MKTANQSQPWLWIGSLHPRAELRRRRIHGLKAAAKINVLQLYG